MTKPPSSRAADSLPGIDVSAQVEPIVIRSNGNPVAVLIGLETFERLVELAEDALDSRDLSLSLASKESKIPWDQLKIELGLD